MAVRGLSSYMLRLNFINDVKKCVIVSQISIIFCIFAK